MTGPRAAELNGALARVRGEKRSLLFYVPESRALEPYVEENHVNSDDRLAVELESGNQSWVFVKQAKLAVVCSHVPCRVLLHAPKICSKCQVASVPVCPRSLCVLDSARVCVLVCVV